MTITDSGAAKNAGIKKYDVITKIGNKSVTDVSSLRTALYKYKVGQSAKITYYRNGKAHTVTVKLTENDSSANSSSSESDSSQQESDQDQQSQDNDDAGF